MTQDKQLPKDRLTQKSRLHKHLIEHHSATLRIFQVSQAGRILVQNNYSQLLLQRHPSQSPQQPLINPPKTPIAHQYKMPANRGFKFKYGNNLIQRLADFDVAAVLCQRG